MQSSVCPIRDEETLKPLACLAASAFCQRRVHYEQTVADIKAAVEAKLGVPAAAQQLFWHNRELTPARDATTLLELGLHTGFCLRGYDLARTLACPSQNL